MPAKLDIYNIYREHGNSEDCLAQTASCTA